MILQCDQCNTKFRLDDSKLKPGGVKVRCSKCRHVFIAGAEQKHEESDFDALLSGLGAPAPEKEAAPPREEAAAPSSLQATGAVEEQETKEPTPEAAGGEFDFGDLDFAAKAAEAPEEEAEAPATNEFDFGDISFETGVATEEKEAAPAAEGDFGEIEFNEEPVTAAEKAPAADKDLDFGDLSFEETAPKAEEPAAAAAESFDFGDFSFEEETTPKEEKPAPASAGGLDFGDFSFEEQAPAKEEKPAPAAADVLDFGEFSFEETAVKEEKAPAAAAESFDFGDFSFEESPAKEEPAPAGPSEELSGFSFEEQAPVSPAAEPEEGVAAPVAAEEKKPATPTAQDEEFSFGEFSFPEDAGPEIGPESEPVPPAGVGGLAGAAGLFGQNPPPEAEAPPVAPGAAAGKGAGKGGGLDFSFGAKDIFPPVSEEFPEQDELPPLSISSRRKGRSVLTVVIIAISIIVVAALSGAGLYLLQSGPTALQQFDKLGLGFVAKWFGVETPEEGKIAIKNPLASFHKNKEAGELFVVNGEAVNNFRKSRASIHVKVSLFDKSGKVLLQKTAYCGNRLSKEQLETLPMEKIESIMNNQFGDSLANLGVKPGQSIGFVVAIANVPKEAADFGVEVVGSTVAGQ